eukprot:jgi/Psemu1/283824/fgenesh1_pg.34_\
MKAKTLGRVASGVVLTASVVVAFVQHATISLTVKNDGIIVGNRHSMTDIVASAGTYLDDDLSSLLESAKNDFGGKTGSMASKVADAVPSPATVRAPITTLADIPTPPTVSEPVTEAVKAAKDAVVSASTVTPIVQEGKARPLFSFVQASVTGAGNPSSSTSSWETSKANLGLLRDNLIRLAGKDPSELKAVQLPKGDGMNAPALDMSHFDLKAIQQYFVSLPPNEKGLVALAATGAFLIAIGSSNKKNDKPKPKEETVDIKATSDEIGGLTDELSMLQSRMKALEANGINLDSQLKEAKSKLTQKELDISKAKLQAAGDSLSMNREIDMLKRKLSENDGKVKTLDDELAKAREECMDLLKKLDEAKEEQEKAKKTVAAKKKEAAAKKAAPPKKAVPKTKAASKKKADPKKTAEMPKKEEKLPEASIAAPKNAAPKKKAAPKKIQPVKKPEKLPEASDTAKKEVAPKKAAVKKVAPKKKAATKKDASTPKASTKTTTTPAAKKEAAPPSKKAAAPTPKKAAEPTPKKAAAPTPKKAAELTPKRASAPTPKKAADLTPKKAAAPTPKKAAPKTADKSDLTTLTKSALSRTTVKVIIDFLTSKGIPTVDKDGKQLKKADLIKAVNAISK